MTIMFYDSKEEFHICFVSPLAMTDREYMDMGYDGYDKEAYVIIDYPYESGRTIFIGVKFDEEFVTDIKPSYDKHELADYDAVVEYTLA